jgi:hypothetical protein
MTEANLSPSFPRWRVSSKSRVRGSMSLVDAGRIQCENSGWSPSRGDGEVTGLSRVDVGEKVHDLARRHRHAE